MNIFEIATRKNFTFASAKGLLNVIDLWALDLKSKTANGVSLDSVAKTLHLEIKNSETVSFVDETASTNNQLEQKMAVVKHIIEVKKKEAAERVAASENAAKRQRIMELIEEKKDDDLRGLSVEELEKKLQGI